MKLKALVITALFVAGIAASVAVAKGPPKDKGKGKDDVALSSSTGSTSTSSGKGKGKDKDKKKDKDGERAANTCKPTVSYVLSGDFVASSGSSSSASTPSPSSGPAILGTFQMKVRQANKHAKDLLGDIVTISYDKKTKFRRHGHADLDDFVAGDRVKAHVRACKAPKQRRQGGTTTGTTASTSTATTTTGTTPGSSDRLLLAKKVDGKPAKAGSTTTGTTSTGTTTATP